MSAHFLVLEHDASDPLMKLGDWLTAAGASVDIRRLHEGHEIPATAQGFDGVISLGGEMGAWDDDLAPWLPATRALLARCVTDQTPTLGICLGAQLMAAATGGTVVTGEDGPEIGAYLAAKRDAAESDPLFNALPMTPDVMQYHYDVVEKLPPGAVLLLSSTGYPNQAWRLGTAAWSVQFHIEPTAEVLREWGATEGKAPIGRLGAMLDDAEREMNDTWGEFTKRFVAFASGRVQPRMPLPLLGDEH